MALSVDINADLGEECGDDAAMLDVVTSASVAAGGHAGGGRILRDAVALAAEAGVAVGAHVSYPDRAGFGRVSHRGRSLAGLDEELLRQMIAVADAALAAGVGVTHVKAHGALYNDACADGRVADLLADALRAVLAAAHPAVGAELGVFAPDGSIMAQAASAIAGGRLVREAFADRAYAADGSLVPRNEPGAVLEDSTAIAERVVGMVLSGSVLATGGVPIAMVVDTVCVHGDTPGAVAHARRVKAALLHAGIDVRPWNA